MRASALASCLLLACSAGDLTLPGSAPPAELRPVAGDDQRAAPGELLEEPIVVQLLDTDSLPVTGSTVEFAFVGDLPGAGLEPAAIATDADGHAATFVRLGTVSGEQMIVARVAGTASPDLTARFTAVASGGGDDKGGGKKGGHGHDEDGDD